MSHDPKIGQIKINAALSNDQRARTTNGKYGPVDLSKNEND